jgi:hypothetical protein
VVTIDLRGGKSGAAVDQMRHGFLARELIFANPSRTNQQSGT